MARLHIYNPNQKSIEPALQAKTRHVLRTCLAGFVLFFGGFALLAPSFRIPRSASPPVLCRKIGFVFGFHDLALPSPTTFWETAHLATLQPYLLCADLMVKRSSRPNHQAEQTAYGHNVVSPPSDCSHGGDSLCRVFAVDGSGEDTSCEEREAQHVMKGVHKILLGQPMG